jgi:ribosome-associated toxin RatA of RatAB toxin-antitoxin module
VGVGWRTVWMVGSVLVGMGAAVAGERLPFALEIDHEPAGGLQAFATVWIPAPPEAVRAVLNDFEHWPELFGGRIQVVQLDRQPDRVVTTLLIKRTPLPGALRLVCETKDLPNGDIVTNLIAGDFRRYQRRWRLVEESHGASLQTRAEMELLVDPKNWAPSWLFAAILRHELTAHFLILKERALALSASRSAKPGSSP